MNALQSPENRTCDSTVAEIVKGHTPDQRKVNPAMQERFLKLSEVRQVLGVSRATVWRWINERGLRVVKVGGVSRVRASDLQEFLKRYEIGESPGVAERNANEP